MENPSLPAAKASPKLLLTSRRFSRAKCKQPKNATQGDVFWLVNLTTKQVETLFGELEYIEPRLKALGVADDDEADRV